MLHFHLVYPVCFFGRAENIRGIASAHNNLGAVRLEMKEYVAAEEHFNEAIRRGTELLASLPEDADVGEIDRVRRVISDRKGNLVVLKLRQNNFGDAFKLLEELLEEDKRIKYVMGCVVKQGILGQYYLQQGELKSAERVFQTALEFIRRRDQKLFNQTWNESEAEVAEQVIRLMWCSPLNVLALYSFM